MELYMFIQHCYTPTRYRAERIRGAASEHFRVLGLDLGCMLASELKLTVHGMGQDGS